MTDTADMTAKPFRLDEQSFLETLGELIERFDLYGSGACFAIVDKARRENGLEGPLSLFDDEVADLAHALFTGSTWPSNLMFDMIALDEERIAFDARFLAECDALVRRYGMTVWLYELINDAAVSMATGMPSRRMPFQLGLHDTREVFRTSKKKRRFVHGRKKRNECMAEYLRQAYRLAAYTLVRWSGDEPRAADTALMLLAYGGLGMCMLRDDPRVVNKGCDPDFGYRNVRDQLTALRIRADLDYASAVGGGEGEFLNYPDCMDARYLHDASRIVQAYRALWNEEVEPFSQVLDRVEREGTYEAEDVWKDPLYLHDLAVSLMGVNGAGPLETGFRLRDKDMFENGVRELERLATNVRRGGLLPSLGVYILAGEPEDRMEALFAPRKERKRLLASCEALADSAATIALYRLPRDRVSLHAVVALFGCDLEGYARQIAPFVEGIGEPDGEDEETAPIMG